MTDRFSPAAIFRAHFKGLKNRDYTSARPRGTADWVSRVVLYGVTLAAGIATYTLGGSIAQPGDLLAGVGILAGALLMAFTQVAQWRERFTERRKRREVSEVNQRDSLDEAAAHLLVAIYAAVGLAVVVIVGQAFADPKTDALVGVAAAAVAALGAYLVLLLVMVLPKLYLSYADINELDDEMSGLDR